MASNRSRTAPSDIDVAKRPAKSRKRRPRQSAIDARNKILDVALQMFADHAYEAVSLRAITIKAKVNVAAPHYYFGTKVRLFAEVFGRCMEPVNRERLSQLDAHMNGPGGPSLEGVVRAYAEPYVRLIEDGGTGSTIMRFLGRALAEQNTNVRALTLSKMDPIWYTFSPALQKVLPDIPQATVYWRFHFMKSAVYDLSRGKHWFDSRTEGLCDITIFSVSTGSTPCLCRKSP